MSMSARHHTAPLASHTGTVRPVSSSVLNFPLEIWLHVRVLASSWLADGPARMPASLWTAAEVAEAGAEASPPAASRVAAMMRSLRIEVPFQIGRLSNNWRGAPLCRQSLTERKAQTSTKFLSNLTELW